MYIHLSFLLSNRTFSDCDFFNDSNICSLLSNHPPPYHLYHFDNSNSFYGDQIHIFVIVHRNYILICVLKFTTKQKKMKNERTGKSFINSYLIVRLKVREHKCFAFICEDCIFNLLQTKDITFCRVF